MMSISMAYMTPSVLARRKTRTNRDWPERYAKLFRRGQAVKMTNRSYRVGGFEIAWIRLTADPVWESTWDMTDEDYEAEGLAYLAENPRVAAMWEMSPEQVSFEAFERWRESDQDMWTIRFEVLQTLYKPDDPCLVPKNRSKRASAPWLRGGSHE